MVWIRRGAMPAILGLFVAFAAGAPASASAPTGYYLISGPADAVGCHSLQVWHDGVRIRTIPADDGDVYGDGSDYECATSRASATLYTGRFVFDWVRNTIGIFAPTRTIDYWVSNGTTAGTHRIRSWGGERCDSNWNPVNDVAFIWSECAGQELAIYVTHGTVSSTWRLPVTDPAAGRHADGSDFAPLYVIVSAGGNPQKIVFVANTPSLGRELWVSNGTHSGTHLLKDIRPGPASSVIHDLYSDGYGGSFTANDGSGRAFWVTDGSAAGTHPG